MVIKEGGSSLIFKPIGVSSKDKGKGLEPTEEEKRKMKELQAAKLRQLNSFLRQRVNDPRGLNKGDANKLWNDETIELVTYVESDGFEKFPKQSFIIENSPMLQVDFPFIPTMFTFI